jgi:predicted transcriptional regulator YdeE
MLSFQYNIVNLSAYRAVGLKWDGAWTEISNLKKVIHSMGERVGELQHAINPNIQLGLSYHLRPDGFVHYSVYEVNEEQEIPEGMIEIKVPEMTYLRTQHKKGENIGQTYQNISEWINESDYKAFKEPYIKYYDELPIKHEKYSHDRDLNDPHFDILIPIVKNN